MLLQSLIMSFSLSTLLILSICSIGENANIRNGNQPGPPLPATCRCIRPSGGGGGCISYDSKYQAATLQEAVTNFMDLTVSDPSRATNIYGQKPYKSVNSSSRQGMSLPCNTVECLACFQAITEILTSSWGSDNSKGMGLGLSNLSPQHVDGGLSVTLAKQCKRIYAGGKGRSPREVENTPNWVWVNTSIWGKDILDEYSRVERDSQSGKALSDVGVSTQLDCSFKRGNPIGDKSGYVGLCNLCWSMRTLSPKYFPRYINELTCHSSDNGCLHGMGKCKERYRSIDVLYNYGTDAHPKWKQYSINSPVSCECQIASGSSLHNFISNL